MRHLHSPQRAFTMIELMIVVAIMGVLAVLAGPPMWEFIGMQRLRSIASQMQADLQNARSEATARGRYVGVVVRNEATEPVSCYTVFTSAVENTTSAGLNPAQCDCTRPVGSACSGGNMREIRTVQVPRNAFSMSLRKHVRQPKWFVFDPVSGGMKDQPASLAESTGAEFCIEVTRQPRGRVRVGTNSAGQTKLCTPDGSVAALPACIPHDGDLRNCRAL